jgi:hypothetical protein
VRQVFNHLDHPAAACVPVVSRQGPINYPARARGMPAWMTLLRFLWLPRGGEEDATSPAFRDCQGEVPERSDGAGSVPRLTAEPRLPAGPPYLNDLVPDIAVIPA